MALKRAIFELESRDIQIDGVCLMLPTLVMGHNNNNNSYNKRHIVTETEPRIKLVNN